MRIPISFRPVIALMEVLTTRLTEDGKRANDFNNYVEAVNAVAIHNDWLQVTGNRQLATGNG